MLTTTLLMKTMSPMMLHRIHRIIVCWIQSTSRITSLATIRIPTLSTTLMMNWRRTRTLDPNKMHPLRTQHVHLLSKIAIHLQRARPAATPATQTRAPTNDAELEAISRSDNPRKSKNPGMSRAKPRALAHPPMSPVHPCLQCRLVPNQFSP